MLAWVTVVPFSLFPLPQVSPVTHILYNQAMAIYSKQNSDHDTPPWVPLLCPLTHPLAKAGSLPHTSWPTLQAYLLLSFSIVTPIAFLPGTPFLLGIATPIHPHYLSSLCNFM